MSTEHITAEAKPPKGYFWAVKPFSVGNRSGYGLELRKRWLLVFSKHVDARLFWEGTSHSAIMVLARDILARLP